MKQRGFTLIEMIVSIAIFMVVAVVAVGSLVRIVALNRQAQALQSSVNNISFALDSMSREIRQGSRISCMPGAYGGTPFTPNSTVSECHDMSLGANQLIFFQTPKTDSTGCNLYYAYWFSGTSPGPYVLQKAQQSTCGQSLGLGNFSSILDDTNVKLTGFNLALFGSAAAFPYKWVFVRMTGYAGVKSQDQNFFDIQTSISQRVGD